MKVIIIGGVAGGASAAARLRRLDEEAEIILLERGGYISYANCGLPYYIGGEITEEEALTLQTPESFHARFRIDVRIHHEAIAIDTAAKTITVRDHALNREYTESYEKLILSPGAAPASPPLEGKEHPRVHTLRTIPDAKRIREQIMQEHPRNAVVVGGGFIGLEMAENLVREGVAVTLVEFAPHVMAALDADMAADVHHYLRRQGVSLRLGRAVKALVPAGDSLEAVLDGGERIPADLVLLATGVRPDTGIAEEAGLALNKRGAILVDEHMRTSAPDVYAVGDAIEVRHLVSGAPAFIPLAGPANKQGRIAADNIAGIPSVFKGSQGSSVLKLFDLTVASTGLSEEAARAAGIDCDKMFTFSPSHATYYPGASSMSIKTVFARETGRILGAQLVGFEGVDKRCDVLATAIRAGMTAHDLTELELCYAPPFSSAKDPVNMAGFAIANVLDGHISQFHWHDVAGVLEDESAILLDVRTVGEYRRGHIEGSHHIPLDSLRDRIHELPTGKRIFVHCQSGLRSYVACRILAQKGFDCANLSGGYRLYASVAGDLGPDQLPRHACGVKV